MIHPPSTETARVAYITCDAAEWYEFAARMRRTRGWQPVFWIAEPARCDYLQRRFPGVIAHNRYDAYHMQSPPGLAHVRPLPLDTTLLEQYRQAEIVALKMMDVMDSVDAFDFNARRRFFHQRLAYWHAIMDEVRPDVCMFAFSAHVIYDYVIYTWCRLHGVRTLMFETTFNFGLLMAFEDPMFGSTEVATRYAELIETGAHEQPIELPAYCEAHLERLKGEYGPAVPWYMREQLATMPKQIAKRVYLGGGDRPAPPRGHWQRWWHATRQALGNRRTRRDA